MSLRASLLALALLLPTAFVFAQEDSPEPVVQKGKKNSFSEADEISLGRGMAASMFEKYPLVKNDKLQRMLNSTGMWIALQSRRPNLPWRFAAIESQSINAFAVPGGTVLVTTGMLSFLNNEAELACVLGHEVAHIVHKHHLKVFQESLENKKSASALTEFGAEATGFNKKMGGNFLGRIALEGGKELVADWGGKMFTLRLDRKVESQADTEGLLYAAKAGYDPAACLAYSQRMAQMKGESNFIADLGKTHPPAAERAADIEAALKRLQGATPGEGARPTLSLPADKTARK